MYKKTLNKQLHKNVNKNAQWTWFPNLEDNPDQIDMPLKSINQISSKCVLINRMNAEEREHKHWFYCFYKFLNELRK